MALFTVAEARAFDKGQLADEAKYADAAIQAEAARIAELFANVCGVAFEPTTTTVVLDGSGRDILFLPHRRVRAVTSVETRDGATWTAFDADALADLVVLSSDALLREALGVWPLGRQNVRVTYTHGYESVPAEIARAALRLAASPMGLIASNTPDGATMIESDAGTFTVATAGQARNPFSLRAITGLPSVDEVLYRYAERVPGIG